ncbi:MAG: hypothetical protein AAGF12_25150, partial [Myxococcota bacterium]
MLGLVVLTFGAIVGSLAYHLQLPLAREAARVEANTKLSALLKGDLEIGRIETLRRDLIVARDVVFLDPNGQRVIEADRVELVFDIDAGLSRGVLRFARAELFDGTVTMIESDSGLPSFIEGFLPEDDSPSTGDPLRAEVHNMALHHLTVQGELLGLTDILAEDVEVRGQLEAEGAVDIDVWSVTGTLIRPFPFRGVIEGMNARIHTDPTIGFELFARGHTEREVGPADVLRANVTYRVPEGQPADSPQELDILVRGEPFYAETLEELGYSWGSLLRGQFTGYFRLRGPPDDLRMTVWGDAEAGPLFVRGAFPADGPLIVEAESTELRLDDLVRGAPPIELSGEVTMQIDPSDPTPRVTITTAPTVYEVLALPALTVTGRLHD